MKFKDGKTQAVLMCATCGMKVVLPEIAGKVGSVDRAYGLDVEHRGVCSHADFQYLQ